MKLILASASPRRLELLSHLGYDFEVVPSTVDEAGITAGRPVALARRLARAKALDVAARRPGACVVGADTIVVQRGAVLNKPGDPDEAREMLTRLRDRPHRVITAVCLVNAAKRVRVRHAVTRVVMRPYGPEEIDASIERGDPFDKAGGYAIQDPLFRPVAAYGGCYCNVVGLPLWPLLELLQAAGLNPPRPIQMPSACDTCVTKPQGSFSLR